MRGRSSAVPFIRGFLFPAILAAIACLVPAAGTTKAQPAPALTSEDLLAATLKPSDIKQLLPNPEHWWPAFPQFNTGLFAPQPGERLFVIQNYRMVDRTSNGEIENALILFDDEKSAAAAFKYLVDADAAKVKVLSGPQIGNESRYSSRFEEGEQLPHVDTVRFRTGSITGRFTMKSQGEAAKPEDLARYAQPIIEKADALLKGSVRAAPIASEIAGRMPHAFSPVDRNLGTAVISIDSWALDDTAKNPPAVRDRLLKLGAGDLGFSRFTLRGEPSQVIDVVLFSFPNEESASEWVKGFMDEKETGKLLPAGKTGSLSKFVNHPVPEEEAGFGSLYDLQFARGRYAGDVACFSPYGETSSACEDAVRRFAEAWYEELGK